MGRGTTGWALATFGSRYDTGRDWRGLTALKEPMLPKALVARSTSATIMGISTAPMARGGTVYLGAPSLGACSCSSWEKDSWSSSPSSRSRSSFNGLSLMAWSRGSMVLAAEELDIEISVMFQASYAECPRSTAAVRIPSPQTEDCEICRISHPSLQGSSRLGGVGSDVRRHKRRIVKYDAGYLTRLFRAVSSRLGGVGSSVDGAHRVPNADKVPRAAGGWQLTASFSQLVSSTHIGARGAVSSPTPGISNRLHRSVCPEGFDIPLEE